MPAIDSTLQTRTSIPSRLISFEYKRLATFCYIDDYPAWVQRRHEFMLWFDLTKRLRLPIHEDKEFLRELKQYHLQYECLRIFEHLPLLFGHG